MMMTFFKLMLYELSSEGTSLTVASFPFHIPPAQLLIRLCAKVLIESKADSYLFI